MTHRTHVAVLLCSLLLACGERPTSPSEVMAVVAQADGIRITNRGEVALAYAAIDRFALALFAPCVDPSPACVRLAPRATALVRYTDVLFSPGEPTEVAVYWWRVVPDPSGGYRAVDLQSVIVAVPRR